MAENITKIKTRYFHIHCPKCNHATTHDFIDVIEKVRQDGYEKGLFDGKENFAREINPQLIELINQIKELKS